MRKVIIFLILVCFITACDRTATAPKPGTDTPVIGHVTFAGSTTLQPLAHELGKAFKARYPDVVLDIAAGGSMVGIQAIHDGTVDIGMASRALKTEEAQGIVTHKVAVDVIAVVVHETNPVEALSLTQLREIYMGEITNWREVGGADLPIVAVVRGKNSGTRGAFDEIVLEKRAPAAPQMRTAATAGDMAVAVVEDPAAIGYVGFGNLEPGSKLVAIDGVLPSEDAARAGAYQLVRPLLFLTGPLTQPLGQMFVDLALSDEGQAIVQQSGWMPAR